MEKYKETKRLYFNLRILINTSFCICNGVNKYKNITLYYIMIVFKYGEDHGGIGDFIKSLVMYINHSIKNNNEIYIHITNVSIKNFIIIKDKYKYKSNLSSVKFMKTPDIIRNKTMNIIDDEKCDISLLDYIDFSDVIYKRFDFLMKQKNIKSYNCIHIRKGDKY